MFRGDWEVTIKIVFVQKQDELGVSLITIRRDLQYLEE
ncbi:DeoR family transcriptional regulator [Enterocloster bolteae]|uniref:DeoR family transcriptional regulator n=1 Tax=Enterocloster bolteae TaxID=208479 RepID=A0A414AKJ2_9FIRM|nr:DeoR family transcriptional regulator [Enterocloster bolteae]RGC05910.1 DeoR family transcriptional regulator [Enterocloster citroniae]RGQ57105.1 DeoR family transcriptional regulator [Enterocloster bolteae]RGS04699.1 DeoR family transcriptional regulator [Enterocloster bolteae]RGV72114.1 DeoR family transcriptional regulator [Enterocloster bolteae]